MSDTAFSVLALFAGFFLITQLWLVGKIRTIVSLLEQNEGERGKRSQPDSAKTRSFTAQADASFSVVNVRVKSNLRGSVQVGDQKHEVSFRDISETGALIDCGRNQLEIGKSYPLEFALPDGTLCASGIRVVREAVEPGLYGVCFEGLSLGTKALLKRYIGRQARDELSASKIERVKA